MAFLGPGAWPQSAGSYFFHSILHLLIGLSRPKPWHTPPVRAEPIEARAHGQPFGLKLPVLSLSKGQSLGTLVLWSVRRAGAKGGGRESPGMRVPFFRVAERKEPKKGRPHCLRPLRFATGQPAVLGFGGVSLELAPFHFAQTIASPDPPNPALLGASRGAKGAGHPHGPLLRSAPSRRRKRHALRRPGRAQRWPEWMFDCPVVWMFGCPPLLAAPAAGRLRGGHGRRSAHAS